MGANNRGMLLATLVVVAVVIPMHGVAEGHVSKNANGEAPSRQKQEARDSMGGSSERLNDLSSTSNGIGNRKAQPKSKRTFVARLYETFFQMTHARLHPPHHRPTLVIVVDPSGRGHSRTIQGAIDMVHFGNKFRVQILIRPGIYREKVSVPINKPFITFLGSGKDVTVITWNARASDRRQSGDILGTYDSASVAIEADYFVARDITFQVPNNRSLTLTLTPFCDLLCRCNSHFCLSSLCETMQILTKCILYDVDQHARQY